MRSPSVRLFGDTVTVLVLCVTLRYDVVDKMLLAAGEQWNDVC